MQFGEQDVLPLATRGVKSRAYTSGSGLGPTDGVAIGAGMATTDGAPDASTAPDSRATEELILRQLGFSKPLIAQMAERARANGTSTERELLASGQVQEEAYYEAMARLVGLPFLAEIAPGRLADSDHLDQQLLRPTMLRLADGTNAPITAICPEAARLPQLTASLARMPGLRRALAITPASTIRRATWLAGASRRVDGAIRTLFDQRPEQSARIVLGGGLGFHIGLLCGLLLAALVAAPATTRLVLHVALSLTFSLCIQLRLIALLHARSRPRRQGLMAGSGPLPVYTVMVGLYREAAVVPQLIASLNRLNWPRSLLDIKLVCEADDPETIAAIRAERPGAHFEIVEVPPAQPRTKPKALNYALNGARGEFVTIYDAEDRPHPDQLLEAYERFARSGPKLACVQAPLIIANAGQGWISAMFALEYAGLFRRLLPALARLNLPLPLGGTSNHFRTATLKSVGAWDPYNVTEDADLGIRLYRRGCRTSVISRQTLEDAPTDLKTWLGQRTRWLKGWMQTWLVVMREPVSAWRQMGAAGFIAFQLLIGGMLLSSLCHPLLFVFVTMAVLSMLGKPAGDVPLADHLLLAVDVGNILGSYAAFLALGATAMILHERKLIGWRWAVIPLYWMLISLAAWKALIELRFRPFFWKKTPHKPHGDTAAGPARPAQRPALRVVATSPAGLLQRNAATPMARIRRHLARARR